MRHVIGKWMLPVLLVAGLVLLVGAAQAQRPEGNGRDSGPMAQFREEHKYTFQLTQMVGNIGRLDSETKAPLTKDQAKKILAVLQPLRTKATLTQDEAKAAIKKLKPILTEKQLNEIGKMKPEHRFKREGDKGQGGNGQRTGGPGAGGQRPHMDMAAMKNFNPFNPPKDSPMAKRGGERMQKLFDGLETKAGVKKAATAPAKAKAKAKK